MRHLLIIVFLVCAGASCNRGNDDRPGSLSLAPASDGTNLEGETIPRIHTVRLSPDFPESGETVQAVTRLESGNIGDYVLEYTWNVGGHRIADDIGELTLPKLRKGDRIRVSVVATNAVGSSEPMSAETEIPNSLPKIYDLRLREVEAPDDGGELWEAEAWARDPDGDPVEIRYSWVLNGRETKERRATFPTRNLKRGDKLYVRAVANDGDDDGAPAESGVIEIANSSPEIVSRPPTHLDASGEFRYELVARDPDGDRNLRYELTEGPRGMKIDALSGRLTWTPDIDQSGRHRVAVAVGDQHGGRATQEFQIPIVVTESEEQVTPASIPRSQSAR